MYQWLLDPTTLLASLSVEKLRLKKQLENKSKERDKQWLEEVERDIEECGDKAQTHFSEIELIEMKLEPLEFVRKVKEGEFK